MFLVLEALLCRFI